MENKTHWKKLINPDYLGSYSLNPGQELTLTIDRIVREKVTGPGGKKQECTVCYFREPQKPFILNRTNQKIIAKVYATPYIEDWTGKKITLYSAEVEAFGETVEALRVRPYVPIEGKPTLEIDTPAYKKVIEYMKTPGASIAKVEEKYTVSETVKESIVKIAAEALNAQ